MSTVERYTDNVEVGGSNPSSWTNFSWDNIGIRSKRGVERNLLLISLLIDVKSGVEFFCHQPASIYEILIYTSNLLYFFSLWSTASYYTMHQTWTPDLYNRVLEEKEGKEATSLYSQNKSIYGLMLGSKVMKAVKSGSHLSKRGGVWVFFSFSNTSIQW